MTDKEIIRAEIEKKIEILSQEFDTKHPQFFKFGKINGLEEILNFINSMPEESVSKDLEEELERFAKLYSQENAGSYRNLITLARHFSNWQKKIIIKKACIWIEKNFNMPDDFEQHFCKAMED